MILVDTLGRYERKPFGHHLWCHMTSDTSLEELHVFAEQIEVQRRWFEDKSTPHYDLNEDQRRLAVTKGAAQVTRLELVTRGIKRAKEGSRVE